MGFGFPKFKFGFVRSARSAVGTAQSVVARIGNAIIGGDFSGDARGQYALDFQVVRGQEEDAFDPALVASGNYAIAFGSQVKASGFRSVGMGYGVEASGQDAVGFGRGCQALGARSTALGVAATALGEGGLAIGDQARAARDKTANLAGTLVTQRVTAQSAPSNWMQLFSAARCTITSGTTNLEVVQDQTLTLPAGLTFFACEVGLVVVRFAGGLVTQPTVRFGVSGNPTKHLAATLCTRLTVLGSREVFLPATWEQGETSLLCGVTVAAEAADYYSGRFFWSGYLVEDY